MLAEGGREPGLDNDVLHGETRLSIGIGEKLRPFSELGREPGIRFGEILGIAPGGGRGHVQMARGLAADGHPRPRQLPNLVPTHMFADLPVDGVGRHEQGEGKAGRREARPRLMVGREEGAIDGNPDGLVGQGLTALQGGADLRQGQHHVAPLLEFFQVSLELLDPDVGRAPRGFAEAVILEHHRRIRRPGGNPRPDDRHGHAKDEKEDTEGKEAHSQRMPEGGHGKGLCSLGPVTIMLSWRPDTSVLLPVISPPARVC